MRVLFLTTTFPRPDCPTVFPWAVDRVLGLREAGAHVDVIVLRGALGTGSEELATDSTLRERLGSMRVQYVKWPLVSTVPIASTVFEHAPWLALPLAYLRV